jgi:hypothetical protein
MVCPLWLLYRTQLKPAMSDVSVGITNERGQAVLAAVSEGPWFFVHLPAGRYHVLATAHGETREQVIVVSPHHQTQLALAWPMPPRQVAQRERD